MAAESPESQRTDRRANNYFSQVAALIVGGWKMSEEGCVCACVCTNTACPFDLTALQTQRERRFCVPRQEVCFHLSRPGQLHSSAPPSTPHPAETKGSEAGWVTGTRASSLVEDGRGLWLGIRVENSEFRCRELAGLKRNLTVCISPCRIYT